MPLLLLSRLKQNGDDYVDGGNVNDDDGGGVYVNDDDLDHDDNYKLHLQAAVHQYEMLSRQQGSTSQVKVLRHFIPFINFISKFDIIHQFHLKISSQLS